MMSASRGYPHLVRAIYQLLMRQRPITGNRACQHIVALTLAAETHLGFWTMTSSPIPCRPTTGSTATTLIWHAHGRWMKPSLISLHRQGPPACHDVPNHDIGASSVLCAAQPPEAALGRLAVYAGHSQCLHRYLRSAVPIVDVQMYVRMQPSRQSESWGCKCITSVLHVYCGADRAVRHLVSPQWLGNICFPPFTVFHTEFLGLPCRDSQHTGRDPGHKQPKS